MIVVVATIAFSAPHLNLAHLEPRHTDLETAWVQIVGVILALSGVEAIANLTGVMKLDPGSTAAHPKVTRTATKAILPVAMEVVAGTFLLGWAMLSLPKSFAPGRPLNPVGETQATTSVPPAKLFSSRRARDFQPRWNRGPTGNRLHAT